MGRKATTCDQKMQNTDLKQGEKNNEKEKKRQRKRKIAGKRGAGRGGGGGGGGGGDAWRDAGWGISGAGRQRVTTRARAPSYKIPVIAWLLCVWGALVCYRK